MDLCKKCNNIYKKWKIDLFAGSARYRPLFCSKCEYKYWATINIENPPVD
jgi:hypothetical protein